MRIQGFQIKKFRFGSLNADMLNCFLFNLNFVLINMRQRRPFNFPNNVASFMPLNIDTL